MSRLSRFTGYLARAMTSWVHNSPLTMRHKVQRECWNAVEALEIYSYLEEKRKERIAGLPSPPTTIRAATVSEGLVTDPKLVGVGIDDGNSKSTLSDDSSDKKPSARVPPATQEAVVVDLEQSQMDDDLCDSDGVDLYNAPAPQKRVAVNTTQNDASKSKGVAVAAGAARGTGVAVAAGAARGMGGTDDDVQNEGHDGDAGDASTVASSSSVAAVCHGVEWRHAHPIRPLNRATTNYKWQMKTHKPGQVICSDSDPDGEMPLLHYFKAAFPMEHLESIVDLTNAKLEQQKKKHTKREEILSFFGII